MPKLVKLCWFQNYNSTLGDLNNADYERSKQRSELDDLREQIETLKKEIEKDKKEILEEKEKKQFMDNRIKEMKERIDNRGNNIMTVN